MPIVFHGLLISLYILYRGCNGHKPLYTPQTEKKTGKSAIWEVLHRNYGAHKISSAILAMPHAQLLCAIVELQCPICFGVLQQPIQVPCNWFVCANCIE